MTNKTIVKIRYCEFTGDKTSPWDGDKKRRCEHIGFNIPKQVMVCMKDGDSLGSDAEGWVTCTKSCESPVQVIKSRQRF